MKREEDHQRSGQVGLLQATLLPYQARRLPRIQIRISGSILSEAWCIGAVEVYSALCRTHFTTLRQISQDTSKFRRISPSKWLKHNLSYRCIVCWAVELLGRPTVSMLTSVLPVLVAWNCILAAVTLRQMVFATAKKAKRKIEATAMRGKLVRVESLVPLQVAHHDNRARLTSVAFVMSGTHGSTACS